MICHINIVFKDNQSYRAIPAHTALISYDIDMIYDIFDISYHIYVFIDNQTHRAIPAHTAQSHHPPATEVTI